MNHRSTLLLEHHLIPNPPMDRDGRGEDTGSGERK